MEKIIEKIKVNCPICNKEHFVEKRKRTNKIKIKDKVIEYEEIYLQCPQTNEEENEYVNAEIMDENLQNLFNRANTLRIKSEFDKAEVYMNNAAALEQRALENRKKALDIQKVAVYRSLCACENLRPHRDRQKKDSAEDG